MIKKTKVCRDCRQELPRKDFVKNGLLKNGGLDVKPNCRKCFAIEMRRKYQTNEKHREYMKKQSRIQYLRSKILKEANQNQHEVV
jgi:hypothetical protein